MESESLSVMSNSLWPHGLYSPWNSPGQNTGVGSLSLPQGIFPTQGLNLGLRHCRWILYQLSHKGSPRILEWVAYPFCRSPSQPRNRTGVSCTEGNFFTSELSGKPMICKLYLNFLKKGMRSNDSNFKTRKSQQWQVFLPPLGAATYCPCSP